jgi:hypothetical protein
MHSYLGRFRLGDIVTLLLLSTGEDGMAVDPAGPPRARIVVLGPPAPGVTYDLTLPRAESPGVHMGFFPLVSSTPPYGELSIGRYAVRYSWDVGGFAGSATACFDVTPGGDAGGRVIALHEVRRPPRSHLVAQLSSGVLVAGSNPRVPS